MFKSIKCLSLVTDSRACPDYYTLISISRERSKYDQLWVTDHVQCLDGNFLREQLFQKLSKTLYF